MSNKEIEKQAEELINAHYDYNTHQNSVKTRRDCAIKAAIVSCKFAEEEIRRTKNGFGHEPTYLDAIQRQWKIKAYLEGLL